MVNHSNLMRQAINAAREGITRGESPFGAAIANARGEVVIAAHNTVWSDSDATAHAEINAIRGACRKLGMIHLHGCVLATTCEPCPMCAAAIHWAQLDAVAFGADIADARAAGFNELALPARSLYEAGGSSVKIHAGVLADECRRLFDDWRNRPDAKPY